MMLLQTSIKPINPTMKLLAALIFIFGVVFINQLSLLILCIGVVLCCSLFLQVHINHIVKRLWIAFPFLLFMLLIVPFQIPGEPIFSVQLGFIQLTATHSGFSFGLILWLKSLNSIMILLLLTETTSLKELQKALHALHVPDLLLQTIAFTFRYFTIIHQEFLRIDRAQKSRGFRRGKSLMNTYTLKIIAQTIGHVFFRALDRSERIYWAMAARGYNRNHNFPETTAFSCKDCGIAIASLSFTCFMIWIDKGGRI